MANASAASRRPLAVALVGVGNVGSTLLTQLQRARTARQGLPQLLAVCNSRRMVLRRDPASWQDDAWQRRLEDGESSDLDALTEHVERHDGPVAIVDATASGAIAARHTAWLSRGIHVVTANKLACAAPLPEYRRLSAAAGGSARYLYETTVGAGLPVLGVLGDFVATGDEVRSVEGILSGTLSRLAAALERGEPFAATLRKLQRDGYTEPDPSVDLAGTDVARKLVILARVAGVPLDLDGIDATPFGSDGDLLRERFAQAAARGNVLRYVARLDKSTPAVRASVGLEEYPASHAFARVKPGDNIIQITTERYRDNPLIIQGPGAGREVTAAGIFADLLRIG